MKTDVIFLLFMMHNNNSIFFKNNTVNKKNMINLGTNQIYIIFSNTLFGH